VQTVVSFHWSSIIDLDRWLLLQAIQMMESDEEEDCEEFPVEINKQETISSHRL
jgi:hypothetical protein